MAEQTSGLRQAGWYTDLGDGIRVDAEFDRPDKLWVAIGPGIQNVSVWMKGIGGFDVRVSLQRSPDGLAVSLDRGDLQPTWSTEEAAPRLALQIEPSLGVVKVTAQRGGEREPDRSPELTILEQPFP